MSSSLAKIHLQETSELTLDSVVDFPDEENWILGSGRQAQRAFSCVIRPEVGDQVLCAILGQDCIIVAILNRESEAVSEFSVPARAALSFRAHTLSVLTGKLLELKSAGDINIDASLGNVSLMAADLFQSARSTFVQLSRHLLTRSGHWQLNVEGSVVTNAENHIMTARRDIKIDATRINMG